MGTRPNVIFFMTDQHNAGSMGCAGHPNVRTPHLDRIAEQGVMFDRAYCNNPICAPSRISFVTGQYVHTHRIVGNNNFEMDDTNPSTLGAVLRRHGYQTALVGKGHMIQKWDDEAYEHIRYCDLCDADRRDLTKHHYFKYLIDNGLADMYEDGAAPPGHEIRTKACAIAKLPYEHSVERWTGNETLEFLRGRDTRRPFLLHMSFERPHPRWQPAAEYADLYDPDEIELGPDYVDWWENEWAGRPDFVMRSIRGRMSRFDNMREFKKALAYHFALVTCIDMEIGRVLDHLDAAGELDNTIMVYSADHGDFAGDHGTCDKNIGIYESIHRIPFLLRYPGGPQGVRREGMIESVDLFPTLCELADVPPPDGMDGESILPVAEGRGDGRDEAICEWDFPPPQRYVNALRTRRYRLVFYSRETGGELYDHETDPYEMHNKFDDPEYRDVRLELLERLYERVNQYARKTDYEVCKAFAERDRYTPRELVQKHCKKWSDLCGVFE